jgi:YidB-like protein
MWLNAISWNRRQYCFEGCSRAPKDLSSVLGADRINALMAYSGMSREDMLNGLSQHLPNVVDKLTPDRRLPTEEEAWSNGRPLGCAPVISLFLIVQVPNASDVRDVSIFLRPFDRFVLSLEGGEDIVRMVFNHIVVDMSAFWPTFGPGLDVNFRHFRSSLMLGVYEARNHAFIRSQSPTMRARSSRSAGQIFRASSSGQYVQQRALAHSDRACQNLR